MASGPGPCCPSGRRLSCFSSTELKKQVESAELKNQRLKEVFQTKIQEFRKACYTLTGYQVDITREGQYRLTSMYAEHKDDCLVFKVGPGGGPRPRSARCHSARRLASRKQRRRYPWVSHEEMGVLLSSAAGSGARAGQHGV